MQILCANLRSATRRSALKGNTAQAAAGDVEQLATGLRVTLLLAVAMQLHRLLALLRPTVARVALRSAVVTTTHLQGNKPIWTSHYSTENSKF